MEEGRIGAFLARAVEGPGAICDVGANSDAAFSRPFIRRGWRALLVEPQAACAAALRRAYPTAEVVQKACDIRPGRARLYRARNGDSQIATLNAGSDPWLDSVRSEAWDEVECDTLTAVLDAAGFPRDFQVLKVDAESWDPRVLAGLDFARYSPEFVVTEEYFWEPAQLRAKYDLLEDAGYVLLGYCGYNSVWRHRRSGARYTAVHMADFWRRHGLQDCRLHGAFGPSPVPR